MRKHKLKNLIKIGVLLFCILIFFINCQKEEQPKDESLLEQHEPEIISQNINFDNIFHRKAVSQTINKLNRKLNPSNEFSRENETDSITILTDDVLYITYADTHTYTLKLIRNNPKYYI